MARDRTRIRQEPMIAFGVPIHGGALIPTQGQDWFVDPNADVFVPKRQWGTGKSDDRPFRTLEEALAACNTGDRIFITGDVREEGLIASNLKFDVQLIGVGSKHHPDQPDSTYHPGGAMIRPPASPTAATDLLEVRGRGWQFHNIAFDCPVDAAAVKLVANALSGVSEFDGSHATFHDCSFEQGLRGIEDEGGVINLLIDDCVFRQLSEAGACAIENTSSAVRLPRAWRIRNCMFAGNGAAGGNESNIDAPLSASLIVDCYFGLVEGSDLSIDLTGGDDNIVTKNLLAGDYSTAVYAGGTNDDWTGNISADTAETEVGDNGMTLAPPAA